MIFIDEASQLGRVHIGILIATIGLSWIIIIGVNIRYIYTLYQTKAQELRENPISFINKYLREKVTVADLARRTGERVDFRKRVVKPISDIKLLRKLKELTKKN